MGRTSCDRWFVFMAEAASGVAVGNSWSQKLFGGSIRAQLEYHAPELVDGRRIVKPPPSVIEEGVSRWVNALAGQLIGKLSILVVYTLPFIIFGVGKGEFRSWASMMA